MGPCPKCGEDTLKPARGPGGVAADLCGKCGGVWLDVGELETALRAEGAPAENLALLAPAPSPLVCPRCGGRLKRGGLLSPSLTAEKCFACGGIWLDADEPDLLKKLAAARKPPPAPAPPASPAVPAAAGKGESPGAPRPPAAQRPRAAAGQGAGFARHVVPQDDLMSLVQGKLVPLGATVFGFGGGLYQILKYLNSVDKAPFETAPGLAGLAQSFGWFLLVTVGCIALFLYGLYRLYRDLSEISEK